METNKSFFNQNKAYIFVGLGFMALTYWYFWLVTIFDLNYVYQFILRIFQGDISGQLVPLEGMNRYQQMEAGVFGPRYDTIAPEVIRAFEERQILLPYVFAVEFIAFTIAFIVLGRKKADITKPDDTVQVYSLFQRVALVLNIVIMIYLFITGFSITFGNITGGGSLAYFMRWTHEVVGLGWIPIWLIITVIAFKDHKFFKRPSGKLWNRIFLRGKYKPMYRLNYFAYVAFGFLLVLSGFLIWFIFPTAENYVEVIQFRRLMLFVHFMGSAIISFFIFETIYSYVVSVKGYLPGLISGRLPREYLEQIRPDTLEEMLQEEK